VAVLEMGMNHFREIAYLSNIARPDVAVIINVGTMHIEHLGTREGILQAKLEILEGMTETAPLFVNGDNDLLGAWEPTHRTIRFGTGGDCAIRGENVVEDPGTIGYRVCWDGDPFDVRLPLEGMHYVSDSLAAVSVGLHMGVRPDQIAARLAAFETMEGRQEIFEAKGFTIIKDCYNAGPESMAAALAVLGKRKGRRIAVLGDMLELGECAPAEHHRVGVLAAQNADIVLAYGSNARYVAQGAAGEAAVYTDRNVMADSLRLQARPGDTILFKGSHGMHMELVLEAFLKEET
jgi:UDP-N-acetylmuramoyl-tripeptide--D-alanyl-D-alanine ligase